MIKRLTALASSALACALGAVFFIAPPASASAEAIQLDEVLTNGDNGALDEFVAFKNTSGSTVNIEGYQIEVIDESDSVSTTYTVPDTTPNTTLAAGVRWIVATPGASGYNNGGTPSDTHTLNIPQRGGVILRDASGVVQDKVAFRGLLLPTGAPSAREGTNAQTGSLVLNPLDLSNQKVADNDHNEPDWDLAAATF
ncbi:lamin tail domain-containing protein [Streptomyces sp. NPDC056257]|uniref:lamin tail domain-containing protein n=1 Tax=Streptomyces sp. NPDC056257 TaxID=3345765 RepID=UPI0035D64EA3